MLVRRVGIFIGQTETDENTGDFEGIVHLGDEWNGTAFADEYGFFLEAFFESSLSPLKNRSVVGSGPWLAGAKDFELAVNGLRKKLADVFLNELRNTLRILARTPSVRSCAEVELASAITSKAPLTCCAETTPGMARSSSVIGVPLASAWINT